MESESSKNKRIAKNTMFLYFRSILMLGIGLYTSRLTLEALGVEDFGIYNVVGGVVAMFSILSGAMRTTSQRFITFALGEGNTDRLKTIFRTSVSLHILLALIVFVLLEVVGLWLLNNQLVIPDNRIFAANVVFHISVATLMVGIICVPYDAAIIAHERMKAFAYIAIMEAVEKLILVVCLLYTSKDRLILYALFFLFCAIIKGAIYLYYTKRNFAEAAKIRLGFDRPLFREMFSFAVWQLFGSGSYVLRNEGIDILLNTFFGVTVNAAKGVCNQVQSAIMQFVGNFQTTLYPQLTKSVAEKDMARTYMLINQGSRFSFYLLMFFCVPLIINLDFLLNIWLVEVPDYALSFIKLTLVYQLMDTLSRCLICSVSSTGKIKKFEFWVGTTKLLAIPLTYVFLRLGGNPLTGLLVNIGLEIICLGQRLWFNRSLLQFPVWSFIKNVAARCWILFVMTYLVCYLIARYLQEGILLIILTGIITTLSLWLFGLAKKERQMLSAKVLTLLKKKI